MLNLPYEGFEIRGKCSEFARVTRIVTSDIMAYYSSWTPLPRSFQRFQLASESCFNFCPRENVNKPIPFRSVIGRIVLIRCRFVFPFLCVPFRYC